MTNPTEDLNYFPKWPAFGAAILIGAISLLEIMLIAFLSSEIVVKVLIAIAAFGCQISMCYLALVTYRAIIKFREN